MNPVRRLVLVAQFCVAMLLLASVSQAQIAIQGGNPLSITYYGTASTALNHPLTVTNTPSVLVLILGTRGATLPEPATLTWNGQTLVRDVQTSYGPATVRSAAIYHLFNPVAGSGNVTGTLGASVAQWISTYTLTGVDTNIAPLGVGVNTGPTSTTTVNLTTNLNLPSTGAWAAVNAIFNGNTVEPVTLNVTNNLGATINSTTISNINNNTTEMVAGYVAGLSVGTNIFACGNSFAGGDKYDFAIDVFFPPATPPFIGAQPQSAVVFTNVSPRLSVAAAGSFPLSYQWYTNNTASALTDTANRSGSTSNVLTLNGSLANVGNYTLVVTNFYGAVTSSVANVSFVVPNGYEKAALSNSPNAFYTFSETADPSTGTAVAFDSMSKFSGLYAVNVANGFTPIYGPQASVDNLPGFPNGNLAAGFSALAGQQVTLPALNLNTNTVTITAWINPSVAPANSAGLVFWRGSSVAGLCFGNTLVNGQYPLGYNWNNDANNYNFNSGLVVPLNQWSLVAVAVSATNATLYVMNTNGIFFATHTFAHPAMAFNSSTLIGVDGGTAARVFNGNIDEVAIYNSTLSQGQLIDMFTAGSGLSYFPASIISQPLPQTVYAGKIARFTVGAIGTQTITYQWYKGSTKLTNGLTLTGSTIVGATNASLTVSNVSAGDAGNYYVSVANLAPPVFSSTNALTLVTPNGTPYETALLAAGPLAHYELDETTDPSTNNTVAFDFVGGFNGIYGTAVLNGNPNYNIQGPQPSTGFPGFTSGNLAGQFTASPPSVPNSVVTLPAWNLSTDTNTWTGTTLSAWINPSVAQPNGAGIVFTRATGTTCGINYLNFLDANNNRILGYSWNNDNSATWSWNSGLTVPQNQWSLVVLSVTPTNATLYVVNTNSFSSSVNILAHTPMSFSGTTMIGSGNANGASAFGGTIDDVAVFAKPLTASQVLALFTNASGTMGFPPTITVAPTNQTLYSGYAVKMQVAAAGTQPLSYQWMAGASGSGVFTNLFNAGSITGSTNTTLTISNVNVLNAGDYVVVITNMFGSVTSSVVSLSVNDSYPFVVTDTAPNPAPYYAGFTATLTASFDGSQPIAYQWVTDGGSGIFTNVPGATNGTLIISNVQAGNAGNYYLTATNLYGGPFNSSAAPLTVVPSTYAIHFSGTNAITTADAVLTHPGVVTGAAVFGGTAKVVTLGNGSSLTFTANGSVATVSGGNTGAFAYPAPATTGNANFDAVLNQCNFDLGPKTITLNNLVAGHNYNVLLIGLDDRGLPTVVGSAPARLAYFQDPVVSTDVSPTFHMGDLMYVMASFKAQTTTQTIIEQLPTGNNGNMNALVVYDLSAVVTPPTLGLAPSGGGNLTLTWSPGSMLLQATNLLGPWTTNGAAISPYTVSPTNAQSFFRVKVP